MAPRRSKQEKKAKKTRKKDRPGGGDPDAPSHEHWKTMKPFKRFSVKDTLGKSFLFTVGDVATVLPDSTSPETPLSPFDWWLCKIVDIRRDESEENAWVKVHWFYSGDDTKAVWDKFDGECCQNYERLISTHTDFVSADCFESVIKMNFYSESAINQPLMPVDEWYCRFHFDQTVPVVKVGLPQDKTSVYIGERSCVCAEPYNPLDGSVVMHFCPRPSCRQAYHRKCLIQGNHLGESKEGYKWRLLCTSPLTDDKDLDSCARPNKRRRTVSTDETEGSRAYLEEVINNELPADLITLACTPAVKGAKLSLGYLNGNIEQVCRARESVYDYLESRDVTVLNGWKDRLDVELAHKARKSLKAVSEPTQVEKRFCCPRCGTAI